MYTRFALSSVAGAIRMERLSNLSKIRHFMQNRSNDMRWFSLKNRKKTKRDESYHLPTVVMARVFADRVVPDREKLPDDLDLTNLSSRLASKELDVELFRAFMLFKVCKNATRDTERASVLLDLDESSMLMVGFGVYRQAILASIAWKQPELSWKLLKLSELFKPSPPSREQTSARFRLTFDYSIYERVFVCAVQHGSISLANSVFAECLVARRLPARKYTVDFFRRCERELDVAVFRQKLVAYCETISNLIVTQGLAEEDAGLIPFLLAKLISTDQQSEFTKFARMFYKSTRSNPQLNLVALPRRIIRSAMQKWGQQAVGSTLLRVTGNPLPEHIQRFLADCVMEELPLSNGSNIYRTSGNQVLAPVNDAILYDRMILRACANGDRRAALKHLDEAEQGGVAKIESYAAVIEMLATSGDIARARMVAERLTASNKALSRFGGAGRAVLSLCYGGDVEGSLDLLKRCWERCGLYEIEPCNILIKQCMQQGREDIALAVLRFMISVGENGQEDDTLSEPQDGQSEIGEVGSDTTIPPRESKLCSSLQELLRSKVPKTLNSATLVAFVNNELDSEVADCVLTLASQHRLSQLTPILSLVALRHLSANKVTEAEKIVIGLLRQGERLQPFLVVRLIACSLRLKRMKSVDRWTETYWTILEKPKMRQFYYIIHSLIQANEIGRTCQFLGLAQRFITTRGSARRNEISSSEMSKLHNIVLAACAKVGNRAAMTSVADSMRKSKVNFNAYTYNTLISGYVKTGDLSTASSILLKMSGDRENPPDAATYTILMRAIMREGGEMADYSTAHRLWASLRMRGVAPNEPLYNALLGLTICMNDKTQMRSILGEMRQVGINPTEKTLRAAVQALVATRKLDDLDSTIDLFVGKMGVAITPITFNMVLSGFAADTPRAEEWWSRICRGNDSQSSDYRIDVVPDTVSHNIMISSYLSVGNLDRALALFENLVEAKQASQQEDDGPDVTTFTCFVHYFSSRAKSASPNDVDWSQAISWYRRMLEHVVRFQTKGVRGVPSGQKPVDLDDNYLELCQNQQTPTAELLEHQVDRHGYRKPLRERNALTAVPFNALINACALHKDFYGTREWLEEMLGRGVLPDARTYSCLINAFIGHHLNRCADGDHRDSEWDQSRMGESRGPIDVVFNVVDELLNGRVVGLPRVGVDNAGYVVSGSNNRPSLKVLGMMGLTTENPLGHRSQFIAGGPKVLHSNLAHAKTWVVGLNHSAASLALDSCRLLVDQNKQDWMDRGREHLTRLWTLYADTGFQPNDNVFCSYIEALSHFGCPGEAVYAFTGIAEVRDLSEAPQALSMPRMNIKPSLKTYVALLKGVVKNRELKSFVNSYVAERWQHLSDEKKTTTKT
ncbi:hypothetical protein BJ742DRAFT_803546 [Cladochytrium replicatum]|nr:hypothetical protein BJ742DRAFT_803546 [Cladochytrium replicatum]